MAVKTNVTINGNDYYRITVDLGRDANGKRVRKQFLGKSKKEAEKKRDEFLNNVQNGITNEKIYLGKAMDDWLWEVVKNDVKLGQDYDTIIISGGQLGLQIHLNPEDLIRVVDGRYADIVMG